MFWRSKTQAVIAGVITEAELVAMSSYANELMWLKQLCTDLSDCVHANTERQERQFAGDKSSF